jgi:hypothetical protein
MSTASSAGSAPTRADSAVYESEQGVGWVTFAGVMLAILGTMNVIYGIAAIDGAHVYTANAAYVFGDLNTFGWFLVGVGTIQFFAAFSIWNQTEWGRWVGVLSASCNSILMLFFLPAFPFLALSIFTLDILVIYGLIAYGGRRNAVD